MRIHGSNAAADARRARGLSLVAAGQTCRQAARRMGVSRRTVERWRHDEQAGGSRQQRNPGPLPRLSPAQLRWLERELKRGAYAQGYAEDY
jgi:transposase